MTFKCLFFLRDSQFYPQLHSTLALRARASLFALTIAVVFSPSNRHPQAQVLGPARTLRFAAPLSALALSGDGRYLAAASGRKLLVYRLRPYQALGALADKYNIEALAFSKDNKMILIGDGEDLVDQGVTVWKFQSAKVTHRSLLPQMINIASISISPDGAIAAVGGDLGEGGHTTLLQLNTGRQLSTLPGSAPAFSGDGRFLLTGFGGMGGEGVDPKPVLIRLWRMSPARLLSTVHGKVEGEVYALAFAKHDATFVSAEPHFTREPNGEWVEDGGQIAVRETHTLQIRHLWRTTGSMATQSMVMNKRKGQVISLSVRRNSRKVSSDLLIWNANSGGKVVERRFPGVVFTVVLMSDDGAVMIIGGGKMVKVWNVHS